MVNPPHAGAHGLVHGPSSGLLFCGARLGYAVFGADIPSPGVSPCCLGGDTENPHGTIAKGTEHTRQPGQCKWGVLKPPACSHHWEGESLELMSRMTLMGRNLVAGSAHPPAWLPALASLPRGAPRAASVGAECVLRRTWLSAFIPWK